MIVRPATPPTLSTAHQFDAQTANPSRRQAADKAHQDSSKRAGLHVIVRCLASYKS